MSLKGSIRRSALRIQYSVPKNFIIIRGRVGTWNFTGQARCWADTEFAPAGRENGENAVSGPSRCIWKGILSCVGSALLAESNSLRMTGTVGCGMAVG